ncbi:MAG TPA: tetratricopeptide repeat protein [Pseudomonadales bacterium]
MPLFLLMGLIQIGFAVHAVKTGRDTKWLYFILLFPGVGCAVYFFVEVLPDLQRSRTVKRAGGSVLDTIDPNRGVRRTAEKLEISNNIDNTVTHAEQCMARGRVDEAIKVLQAARKGIFEDDPKLLLALAQAEYEKADFAAAGNTLEHLIAKNPDFKSVDGHLLYARALEGQGNTDKALAEYAVLAEYYPGPEARCHYGLFLKKLERMDEAKAQFHQVLLTAKHSPRHYYQMHRQWIDLAKREA